MEVHEMGVSKWLAVGAPLQSYRRGEDGGRGRVAPFDGELAVLLV